MSARELASLAERLSAAGITQIRSYAWRDLDDPDAGGSEVHAHEILSRWAGAGLDVVHRTSSSPRGGPDTRGGYGVVRRGGRYGVFPRVLLRRLAAPRRRNVAVVEIWNGVPWFSPLWNARRGVVWLHHLHDDMWADSLPWPLSGLGRQLETRWAPPVYRRSPIMTLAESTAASLVSRGFPARNVHVVHPGVNAGFSPTGEGRTSAPTIVAVGRLAPVKRFEILITQFRQVLHRHPGARLVIVGTGPLEENLRSLIAQEHLEHAVRLAGRIDHAELVSLYSTAWLLTSASHSEGWGMTITEAAACGTASVVTDNDGHRIAVEAGRTGLVVSSPDLLGEVLADTLSDPVLVERLGAAARRRSESYSWDRAAVAALELLVVRAEGSQSR